MQLNFNKYLESDEINYLLFVVAFVNLIRKKMFIKYTMEHYISIESSVGISNICL